jgi:hypothetical protein
MFTGADLDQLVALVAASWRDADGADWSVPAGTLDWSCHRTAVHAIDTVTAPALFLASRRQDRYPTSLGIAVPPAAGAAELVEALSIAARLLTAVVATAGRDEHAVIWRRPVIRTRPPGDFVPRGALELILHAHDVSTGLGIPFDPPRDLCERLRRHTCDWPVWQTPGWAPLTMTGDPWADLLRSSGRAQES